MVTTRHTPGAEKDAPVELPASGKVEAEAQRPTKRPKTKPLQEANEEIEKAIAGTYSKEQEELTQQDEEMATSQAEKSSRKEEDYVPSRQEEEEAEAEEEEAGEEMEEGAVPAEEALQEMGEAEGEEEGEETVEVQGKGAPPMQKGGAGKKKGSAAAGVASSGGGKKPAIGIQVGQMAPDFTLKNQDNQDVSLKSFRGKIVALYFYNKDDTAVVSKGSAAFAKLVPEMEKMGGTLLFIGPDSVSSHKKFKEKAKLNFQLLSDAKKEVAKTFRCLRGRNVTRCTVLVDPEGKIMQTWPNIPEDQVEDNPPEAMAWLKSHMPAMTAATTA